MLEVVDDPLAAEAPVLMSAAAGFQGISINSNESDESGGISVSVSSDDEGDNPPELPAFKFEEAEAPQREAPSFADSVGGSTSESTRRRPSKQANPLPQMVGVVLGGLASIPLAQLCLWWIFSTDPVDAGPFVAQYVPFVVPADFRGASSASSDETDEANGADTSRADTSPGRTLLGRNDPTPFANGGNRSSGDDDSSNDSTDGSQSSDDESTTNDQDPGGLGTNNSIPDVVGQSPEDARNVQVDPLYLGLADPHEQLRKIRKTEADEIYVQFQSVLDGYEVWSEPANEESDTRSEAIDQYYQSMCELGSSLLYINPDEQRSVQAVLSIQEALSTHFRDDADKLRRFIGNRAARLLQQPTDLVGNGVALAGTLVSVEREGDYLVSLVRLDDVGRTEVKVYGWIKPPRHFEPGCKVMMLGERINDPDTFELDVDEEIIAGSFLFIVEAGGISSHRQVSSEYEADDNGFETDGRNVIIE